ncbi:MAG TPA: Cof-type HAD-IIB family hydrolase [Pyrinomonadaceae bacterium]|nr:Cof-type HAD-IIB family hydrolase [Pyrinomonadaceae bacterium]
MIKLLALDLDGTTLNSRGEIPDANRAAIRAAEEKGVLVTIATGRRFRDAQPVGIDLGLNAPLITHNGGLLKYADTEETVHCSLLATETSLEVVRVGKESGGDALVSTDPHGQGTLLYDRISDDNMPLKKYLRWSEGLHGDEIGRSGVAHVPRLEDILEAHEIVHISFSGCCDAMRELEATLKDEFRDMVTVLATIYPSLDFTLLDILPPDASKGHGVARLAEINGFTSENVMAMGDNFNDLEMLEYAGTAVVMGNADAKLREMPNFYTTLSNDEGGVAAAVKRFILNQENN